MSRILVLFDTKSDAGMALDQLHQLNKDIDVRVHEYPGAQNTNVGAIGPGHNLGAGSQGMFVPVTGWTDGLGLNDDESAYFVDRLRPDSSLVVIEAEEGFEEQVREVARRFNGLLYQDH